MDKNGTFIRACVQMPHKGYTISLSSLMTPNEIGIIDPAGRLLTASFTASVEGFQKAVAHIDKVTA